MLKQLECKNLRVQIFSNFEKPMQQMFSGHIKHLF